MTSVGLLLLYENEAKPKPKTIHLINNATGNASIESGCGCQNTYRTTNSSGMAMCVRGVCNLIIKANPVISVKKSNYRISLSINCDFIDKNIKTNLRPMSDGIASVNRKPVNC